MLSEIDIDNENDIDNLLEDSDTYYVAEEPLPETKEESHNILQLKLTFILKVPPRVVILKQQRRNSNKRLILWNGSALKNSSN